MSLKEAAKYLAAQGRGNDSLLVHMSPKEVAELQQHAKRHGTSLTVNPQTGLPEAFSLEDVGLGGVEDALEKAAPTIAGATISYLSGGTIDPITAAAMVGGVETARTGSLQKGLMAGFGAYGGAGLTTGAMNLGTGALSQSVGSGLSEEAAQQAVADKLASAGPMDKLGAAGSAFMEKPLESLKTIGGPGGYGQLAKYGLAATLPMLADKGVSTTTPMPSRTPGYIRQHVFNQYGQPVELPPVRADQWGSRRFEDVYSGTARAASGGIMGYAEGGDTSGQKYFNDYYAYKADPSTIPSALTDDITKNLMYQMMTTGVPTSDLDKYGGQAAVNAKYELLGGKYDPDEIPVSMRQDLANKIIEQGSGNYGIFKWFDIPLTQKGVDNLYKQMSQGNAFTPELFNMIADPSRLPIASGAINPTTGKPFSGALKPPTTPVPTTPTLSSSTTAPVASGFEAELAKRAQTTGQDIAKAAQTESAYNRLTGDSLSAYNYLMGKTSAYPYRTTAPQVSRPYSESVRGIPYQRPTLGKNSPYIFDASGSVIPNPDYVSPAAAAAAAAPTPTPPATTQDSTAADGGLMATGGIADAHYNLGGYSDGGRLLKGPGDGISDSIPATIGQKRQPARLADGEFVVPARIVSELGNGSTEAGARKLYAMMDRVQKARANTTGKGKVAKDSKASKYLPA